MSTIKQIREEIELVITFKLIAQAFEEISVLRMQKMRNSVITSREFVNKLGDVFYDVRSSYQDKIKKMLSERTKDGSNKKKKLSILVSANTKLYGPIITSVFESFYEATKNQDTDIMIIGKLGLELFEAQEGHKNYLYFEIPDAQVFLQDVQSIMYQFVQYENIDVYYAHFENILNQKMTISNITGDKPFDLTQAPETYNSNRKFIFEPKIEEILNFFKTQVFVALFKQTVHEAHLAHYASRVNEMEKALTRIERDAKILYSKQRKAKKHEEDRKSLERIAGRQMWAHY